MRDSHCTVIQVFEEDRGVENVANIVIVMRMC
jgi:hypothetical protein